MSHGSGKSTPRKLTGPLRLDKAIAEAKLSRGLKATLHAIGRNLNFQTWTCFPSLATIATSAGYSSRRIRTQLGELRDLEVLTLEYRSRGGRTASGRGVTHTFRLNIDRLEALANPEAISSFTRKSMTPNAEVRDAEPGSRFRQTNHPSHKLDRPSDGPAEPERESTRGGWMDGPDRNDLRAELTRNEIAGPNLDALVSSGKLTVEQVRAEAASVSAGSGVRDKAAVLVKRLQTLAGIVSTRSKALDPDMREAMTRIEQLRRNRSRES